MDKTVDKPGREAGGGPGNGVLPGQMAIPGLECEAGGGPGTATAAGGEWLTRDEAARTLGKAPRTIDRLRKRGVLKDLDEGGTVRISRASVEKYARRPVEPRPGVSMTTVEAEHYDGLLVQLQRQTAVIEQMKTQLLTWEGEKEDAAARLAEAEAEKAQLAAALEKKEKDAWDVIKGERAEIQQLKEERARLETELAEERAKGFWRRLFGG